MELLAATSSRRASLKVSRLRQIKENRRNSFFGLKPNSWKSQQPENQFHANRQMLIKYDVL